MDFGMGKFEFPPSGEKNKPKTSHRQNHTEVTFLEKILCGSGSV